MAYKNIEDRRRWDKENPEKVRKYAKDCRKRAPDRHRSAHLKNRYGITEADYLCLLEKQAGVCAICGLPPVKGRLAVDHCHKTQQVRGLIHRRCNSGIGLFNDDPVLLKKALDYLTLFTPKTEA